MPGLPALTAPRQESHGSVTPHGGPLHHTLSSAPPMPCLLSWRFSLADIRPHLHCTISDPLPRKRAAAYLVCPFRFIAAVGLAFFAGVDDHRRLMW